MSNALTWGAVVVALAVIAACTFLVAHGDVDGNTFMLVVIAPAAGSIFTAAGAKVAQKTP